MSQWETIITSVISSGLIASASIFVAKKTIEKGIETKFKQIENQHKIDIEENKRREAKLFDDRYELYKIITSLLYRVRNSHRDLANELESNEINQGVLDSISKTHDEYSKLLDKLIFDNRVIFPDIFFNEIHDLNKNIAHSNQNLRRLLNNKYNIEEKGIIIKAIQVLYKKIENHYNVMLGIMQVEAGVKKI